MIFDYTFPQLSNEWEGTNVYEHDQDDNAVFNKVTNQNNSNQGSHKSRN